jgi:Poly(ADP-ribose) polymerase catalytic domain
LLFRHGLYFAEKSEYSNNYAFQPAQHSNSNLLAAGRPTASADEREMFLTKLLVGDEIEMNRDESAAKAAECRALTAPPVNVQTNLRYNTVTGHTKGSRVWIVYENGRAYPDYLVRYYRQPRPDLHRTRYGSLEEAQRFHKLDGASHTVSSSDDDDHWVLRTPKIASQVF